MVKLPCVKCKGSNPSNCGREFCPIYAKAETRFKVIERIDKEFLGNSPPTIFIGSKLRYPKVNVGILSPLDSKENSWEYDAPTHWYNKKYNIRKIINFRASLINSRFQSNVHEARSSSKFLELSQEIAMSFKTIGIEFQLKKRPKVAINFNDTGLPMGPAAPLKKATPTENISIPRHIDKVVSDTDLKSLDALKYLSKKGFDEHQLTQLLSIGVLGLKKNRRLVPSRWSITAIDDTLAKEIIKEIKLHNTIGDYRLYFGDYMGNYYYILLFPEIWSYELFEMYMPNTLWNPYQELEVMTDHETYKGRTKYAENCVGGYYSVRYAVLEYLKKQRKQATALIFRFTTDEYTAPLGVWVTRQSARNAMSNSYLTFDTKEKLIEKTKDLIYEKFNYKIDNLLKKSTLLRNIKTQMRLSKFF